LLMRSNKLIKKSALLGLMLLCITLTSCASKPITLYPIQPTDFYIQDNGDVCMSEFYFNEVLQAKIAEK
jgi:hypothetical protein